MTVISLDDAMRVVKGIGDAIWTRRVSTLGILERQDSMIIDLMTLIFSLRLHKVVESR